MKTMKNNMERQICEKCKYYERCSKNIYDASIERDYLIFLSNRDCWKANEE